MHYNRQLLGVELPTIEDASAVVGVVTLATGDPLGRQGKRNNTASCAPITVGSLGHLKGRNQTHG